MTEGNASNTVNRERLFWGICLALLPTAFSFVLVSNILNQLKTEFILTNGQVGYIGGAALWGMAVSLLTVGPFLEKIGFKRATQGAFVGHLAGVTLFLAAYPFAGEPYAFWILFLGAIGFGAGNGMIEVAGNPMVTSLYPKNKTTKLNHFHAFFPGGMVFGGLLGWVMTQIGVIGPVNIGHWTLQIAIIYIPIFAYGAMILPEKFPKSETEEAGIPFMEVVKYTFTHPLVIGLILLKMVTLSIEMGPSRWIPEVLQAAGVHGMLVFVWISGLMMVLRMFAAPFVEKFSPTGMLLGASVLTGSGLLMFAFIESGLVPLMLAGTVFACGVAFYFPTMVGLMSERFPKAGSLGIVLMIGMGFLAAGGSNAIMGEIADSYLPDGLDKQQTISVLEQVEQRYPSYVEQAEAVSGNMEALADLGYRAVDVQNALNHTQNALEYYRGNNAFDGTSTGNALRAIVDSGVSQEEELITTASAVLRPADNYGGRMSFYWIGPVGFLVAIVFLILFINDKKKGGYQAVRLEKQEVEEPLETK
ncbi:MFS transporter [Aliifodinibius sp. S!AR15-10]|uniref:MFS transporter n=1 Tax=Aliifodinibius sp. S!AR15-10 TaxID=2950437 RepID=UPI00285E9D88|nr:MFS transporter [Aliifodinibius sp. S!AR15-10]MDR8390193.1 MFS transporter [Aliifodinibius sp. S!AR15-10]